MMVVVSFVIVVCFEANSTENAFTQCGDSLKTVKNVTVAKFELDFKRCRHNLTTTEDSTVTSSVQSLQKFYIKELYLHLKSRLASF